MLPMDTSEANHITYYSLSNKDCKISLESFPEMYFCHERSIFFLLFVESFNKGNKLRVALRNEMLCDPCRMQNDESFLKCRLSGY